MRSSEWLDRLHASLRSGPVRNSPALRVGWRLKPQSSLVSSCAIDVVSQLIRRLARSSPPRLKASRTRNEICKALPRLELQPQGPLRRVVRPQPRTRALIAVAHAQSPPLPTTEENR